MATIREKQPGVWEVRVFTGTNARGRPTQLSRTVRGSKRDASRVAAELEVGPGLLGLSALVLVHEKISQSLAGG